jgi:hypothetical protein
LIQDQGSFRVESARRAPGSFSQPWWDCFFVPFVHAGLCLPASPFLQCFLRFFDVSLNHLTPNGVLHLSVFVHFCEAFLGIPPSITLFCYFFRLKPHPKSNNTSILGRCGIQFCQIKQKEFFEYTLVDLVRD